MIAFLSILMPMYCIVALLNVEHANIIIFTNSIQSISKELIISFRFNLLSVMHSFSKRCPSYCECFIRKIYYLKRTVCINRFDCQVPFSVWVFFYWFRNEMPVDVFQVRGQDKQKKRVFKHKLLFYYSWEPI